MKFLRRTSVTAEPDTTETDDSDGAPNRAYTPAKGRPTPKRREAEGRRKGPVAPPPRTQREAMKRGRGNKEERRKATAERRERMAAGDDRYLLARDKGPVRAYVRDFVDSRRRFVGLLMPLVIVLFIVLFIPSPALQQYVTTVVLLVLIGMVIDAIILGRSVVKRVRAKFPKAQDRTLSLGWYAGIRASQVRKLRMPKPRVSPGDSV